MFDAILSVTQAIVEVVGWPGRKPPCDLLSNSLLSSSLSGDVQFFSWLVVGAKLVCDSPRQIYSRLFLGELLLHIST